jgi:integrase
MADTLSSTLTTDRVGVGLTIPPQRRGRLASGWLPWSQVKKLAQQPGSPRAIGPNCEIHCTKPGQAILYFRYQFRGAPHRMGLGPYQLTSAVELRETVEDLQRKVRGGVDPLAEKQAAKQAAVAAQTSAVTFADAAEKYISLHERAWRNPKHRQQWRNTIASFALPVIGKLPIEAITTDHVLQVLEPIWAATPETASRLRGRIEAILDASLPSDRVNPAMWRGRLKATLPVARKLKPIEHHAALPWREIPAFMARLRTWDGVSARALEFTILAGVRSGETRGARWREISDAVWMIPAMRTKTRKEHRIPLADAALAVLQGREACRRSSDDLIFPGLKDGVPLSDMSLAAVLKRMGHGKYTVHGFRSGFRDWAAETTGHDNIVVEMALGHAVGSAVEASYRRGDLFEKRKALMAEWAAYCAGVQK